MTTLRGLNRREVADALLRAISDAGGHGVDAAFARVRVEVYCNCTCTCHEAGACMSQLVVGRTADLTDCPSGCRWPGHECEPRP